MLVAGLVAASCATSSDSSSGTSASPSDPEAVGDAELTPLIVRGGPDVVAVKGSDGRYHLLWEVPLQNATSLELTVTAVDVEGDGTTLSSLDGAEIADSIEVLGTRMSDATIGPAEGAYLFLTLAFDTRADVPVELTHSLTVTSERLPEPITVTGGAVTVDSDAVVPVLGPPLEAGNGYIAADGCCGSTRHIRAPLPVDNDIWFSQRFAIDWEQINADGQFLEGDPTDPESYLIYADDVLAAASGTVVHTLDGLEDQVPGELPGTAIPLAEADGNTVVIDIGDGLYVLYAHLQKGSVSVEVGDRVEAGQSIGRVGNTGNSSAPHLHFHVTDGPSPLASNGRPYVIDSFDVTAVGSSTEDLDRVENTTEPLPTVPPDGDEARRDELPLDLSIVTFG